MNKDGMLKNLKLARTLLDEVYYHAERYNEAHRTNANPHMIEIERLMSWCDSCAMDAESEIERFFNETA